MGKAYDLTNKETVKDFDEDNENEDKGELRPLDADVVRQQYLIACARPENGGMRTCAIFSSELDTIRADMSQQANEDPGTWKLNGEFKLYQPRKVLQTKTRSRKWASTR